MSVCKFFPRHLFLAAFTTFITSLSISINGELQSGRISKFRSRREILWYGFNRYKTTVEPFDQITTTEDPETTEYHPRGVISESNTVPNSNMDLGTTERINLSETSLGMSGSLKNGTVSSPECMNTKEEAYCQRVLIIAILLVTCTIVTSVFIICLLQYFYLRKYTFYLNEATLPFIGYSNCTAFNGVPLKEVI